MRIVAKYSVEVGGHIYSKGDALEWSGAVTPRIAANFTDSAGMPLTADGRAEAATAKIAEPKDGKAAEKELVAKTVASLKREGIKISLDQMHVTYSANSSTDYLARLLLVQRGEIEA
jgi:hypothetical protein